MRSRRISAVALTAVLTATAMVAAGARAGARLSPEVAASSITVVQTDVPAGTTAVLANITMTDGAAPGYITAQACDTLGTTHPNRSSGNHGARQAVANLAVVPVDAGGRFCIYTQSTVELVVDIQGRFAEASDEAQVQRFQPVAPTRLIDTREDSRPADASLTAVSTGLPTGTAAALVNLTMVNGAGAGYVTADRCSDLTAGPQARSSANHVAVTAASNLAIVQLDADGRFCIGNHVGVDLVVDLQGSFGVGDAALGFAASAGERVLDTRTAASGTPPPRSITRVDTGLSGTGAALVNIAMVAGAAPGYISADRCSSFGDKPPRWSSGNHVAGPAISNLVVVPLDADGSFCIYNQVAVDLVVDLQGAFSSDATQGFFPVPPARVLDTRPAGAATPRTSCASVVHIGDSTSVGLISPSYLADPALRVDAQYRRVGVVDPRMEISGARSIVETLSGQVNARDTAAAIKATGYEGCWVLALGTTDTANIAAGSGPGRRERIQRMMAVVGDDPVVWVNVRTAVGGGDPWSNVNMQLWNQALAAEAPLHPNLHVYDWSAVMNPTWLSADRIHYTSEGYAQRARLVADALAAALPG